MMEAGRERGFISLVGILILSVLFPPIFKTMNAAFQILKNVE